MKRIKQLIDEITSVAPSLGFGSNVAKQGVSETDLSNLGHVDLGLLEFWQESETAELFKDMTYGQWGLRILTPKTSHDRTQTELIERRSEMLATDLVFAEFLGDSDLLLMDLSVGRRAKKPIYAMLPLDRRDDWPKVANSFEEFLEKYLDANGEKFWESGIPTIASI
jgi:hypothetical protein